MPEGNGGGGGGGGSRRPRRKSLMAPADIFRVPVPLIAEESGPVDPPLLPNLSRILVHEM